MTYSAEPTMDEQALAGIIEQRKTLEEYVKYVGVYCLEGRQAWEAFISRYAFSDILTEFRIDIARR